MHNRMCRDSNYRFPTRQIDLAFAMKQNPSMRVLVQQGYYDLATPHLATEYFVDHMDITEEQRKNINIAYYEAGHMMYIHEASLEKYKMDLGGVCARQSLDEGATMNSTSQPVLVTGATGFVAGWLVKAHCSIKATLSMRL